MIIMHVALFRGIGGIQKVGVYTFRGITEAKKGSHVS